MRSFDKYFPWIFSATDFLASFLALIIWNGIVQYAKIFEGGEIDSITSLAFVWILIAGLRKDYKIGRTDYYDQTLTKLLITAIWFIFATSILWLLFKNNDLQITHLLSLGLGMLLLMGIFRVGIHILLRHYKSKEYNYRNAIIVGKENTSSVLADIFQIRKDYGINFIGYYDDQADCHQTRGGIHDFFQDADKLDLDLIYIHGQLEPNLVKKVITFADENSITVKMIPGESMQMKKNLSWSRYGDFFVINVNKTPLDNVINSFAKRAFDILFAGFVILFVLSWLIPVVGLLIKLESKGPVFFIQKRNGVNNKVFNCLKFRSMNPNDFSDVKQATKNDSRITRAGAYLRASSLDEMPQFINVFLGDMSVVGPRPHTVPMNQTFKTQIERYNLRHKIRPGITGLAQVSGYRGEIVNPFQIRSRVRLDSFYIHNWSFLLDIGIMIKTFRELINSSENAY